MNKALVLSKLFNSVDSLSNLKWEPYLADGRMNVEIFPLYNARDEKNQGPAAALLRYKPGAQVTRHVHDGYELIFVLEGVLVNDSGAHGPGTLEICPPGSEHALSSLSGCVFLVVWEQPVRAISTATMAA